MSQLIRTLNSSANDLFDSDRYFYVTLDPCLNILVNDVLYSDRYFYVTLDPYLEYLSQ